MLCIARSPFQSNRASAAACQGWDALYAAAKDRIVGIQIGATLLQVLQNLVNLLGIPSWFNFAVMGAVILMGDIADHFCNGARRARKEWDEAVGH